MSIIFDKDVYLHERIIPGQPGTGMDEAEFAALRNDIDTLLTKPVIDELLDIPDVTGTPADGDSLVWDAGDDRWETRAIAGNIARVDDHTSSQVEPNVSRLTANVGLTAARAGSGWVAIHARFAGSGSANLVARSDHTHAAPYRTRSPFSATGTLSSGTRTLISGNVTGLDPTRTYRISARAVGDVQGEGTGAGYTMPVITLDGAAVERFGEVRSVSGVPREWTVDHGGVTVSGVSSVAYNASIQYRSGDPINIRAGLIVLHISSDR